MYPSPLRRTSALLPRFKMASIACIISSRFIDYLNFSWVYIHKLNFCVIIAQNYNSILDHAYNLAGAITHRSHFSVKFKHNSFVTSCFNSHT
nr:MAG TPA: hypothetical protein [Caudoviricetes sp.]